MLFITTIIFQVLIHIKNLNTKIKNLKSKIKELNSKSDELSGNLKQVKANRDGLIEQDEKKSKEIELYQQLIARMRTMLATTFGNLDADTREIFKEQSKLLDIQKDDD
ncbi:hypothetical protein [Lactiplantibacillus plantarum]|uniref:hypothetical protein n=1 Tax=Lactiplantibacillus plantarum TaxID=1590 RepID=UPI003C26C73A